MARFWLMTKCNSHVQGLQKSEKEFIETKKLNAGNTQHAHTNRSQSH